MMINEFKITLSNFSFARTFAKTIVTLNTDYDKSKIIVKHYKQAQLKHFKAHSKILHHIH